MKEQLQSRLQELKSEYQKGQERLAALDQEVASVKTSMLRISGAIQVLEELVNKPIEEGTTPIPEDLILSNGINQ